MQTEFDRMSNFKSHWVFTYKALYTDCIETNGSRNCEIDSHETTTATSEEIKGGGLNIGYKILIALSAILMVGGILCAVLYKTYWRKKSRKAISESELREFGKLLPIRDENAGRPKKKHRCTKNKIRHGSQIVINEEDTIVEKLSRKLITMYDERAKCIPVSPLQKSFKLPLQQIYASVDISEDLQYNSHQRGPADDTHKPNQDSSGIDSEQEQSCINKTNQDPGANTMVSPYYIFCEVSDPESPPEPVEEIYLLGEAGRGKTTHCLWLIKQWCDAKTCQEPHMNDWQRYMNKFHIVFYLPIQNVSDPSRETFIDMFCNEMLKNEPNLHKTVEHVLHSESYHCLIIIDGLEDWKQSRDDTLPKFDKMSKCVYLITMRPWKFDSVEDTTLKRNKVLEIKGLDDEGMKQLIGNILVHHYKLKPDSECYKEKYHEITGNMEIEPFKSFMRIPLSAVFYIQICNTEGCSIESISSLYTAFFNMLIERVYTKKVAQKIDQLAKFETDSVPSSFTSFVVFTNCISLLSKLGKLAYDSLISDRKIMKYQRKELPKLVGDTELELALHFGLISLKETISVSAKQVTVNFFHKSAEEFLAAIYIVTEKESELLIKRLTNVNEIMKLSGVIKFICGISPSLGSRLSEEVAKVSEGDKEFCDKKKLPPFDKNRALAELFNQQINWYNELQDSDVTFQVSDIYLWRESIGNDAIRISRKLMFDRKTRIRSLTVVGVPEEGENALSNEDLNTFLADPKRTGSLAELSVIALTENERTLNNVSVHSLEALYLSKVMIHGTGESSTGPLILSGMENLKRLYLSDMPKLAMQYVLPLR